MFFFHYLYALYYIYIYNPYNLSTYVYIATYMGFFFAKSINVCWTLHLLYYRSLRSAQCIIIVMYIIVAIVFFAIISMKLSVCPYNFGF